MPNQILIQLLGYPSYTSTSSVSQSIVRIKLKRNAQLTIVSCTLHILYALCAMCI